MTYSPYGDRDSGGTRTNVDTEVHDDQDQEDRAVDGVDGVDGDADGQDANGQDADGHDANGMPFQRASDEDAFVGGAVVDQDGNVVEASDPDGDSDGDVDGRDEPEPVVAESSDVPNAIYTEHGDVRDGDAPDADARDADAPDAEANTDDAAADDISAAATDTEAGAYEGVDGHVRTDDATAPGDATAPDDATATDEATATDVDAPEHAEGTVERDSTTEDAMAGDDRADEVSGGVADERDEHAEHDEADGIADVNGEREYTDGEPAAIAYGEPAAIAYGNQVDADPTAASADVETYADDRHPDDTDADRAAVADGAFHDDMADAASDGDGPVAGAVDADYVAVGVAEPLSESEAADIAEADSYEATRDADDGAVPFDAATAADAPPDATVVGMMPGDAPVVDATAQPIPDADATHDRWQQIQLGFIDDPRGSVESARSLVVEAVEARISALRDRQNALDGWQNEATPDTEVLRAAIKGYRDLLNSLTGTP